MTALDPSGTAGLAKRMTADINRRLASLDLRSFVQGSLGSFGRWYGMTPQAIVEDFRAWLLERLEALLLDGHFSRYVRAAYQAGWSETSRSVQAVRGVFPKLPGFTVNQLVVNDTTPLTGEARVEYYAARLQEEMRGLTDFSATRLSRVLLEGLERNSPPEVVAKRLVKALEIPLARARTIARTELVRAKAEAQLDAFERFGENEVGVKAEYKARATACPKCRPFDGKVMTIAKARGMIPVHPRCRCRWVLVHGRVRKGIRQREPARVSVVRSTITGRVFRVT